jgi:DNA repair protein RadC
MSIASWPCAERPREKLLKMGAGALSDAELLAIFVRSGMPGLSAVDIARQLIGDFGSLSGLMACSMAEFVRHPGLGPVKYAQLMAVRELSQRALLEELELGDVLDQPGQVRDYLRLLIGCREIEVFVVIFLSVRNHVLSVAEIFSGSLTETRVYPREVVRQALLRNASAVIVAHNHPSGTAEPSAADILLTSTLRAALQLVDIGLLDHFVISRQQSVSLCERGFL